MNITVVSTIISIALAGLVTRANAAVNGTAGVFANCDTAEGLPMMNIQVRKNLEESRVMAYLATLQPGTRFWTTTIITGNEVDLGREPICEVYEFNAKQPGNPGIQEIHVCFERHEDGSYGGVMFQATEDDSRVERRLKCAYPAQG